MIRNIGINIKVDNVETVLTDISTIPYEEQVAKIVGNTLEGCCELNYDLIASSQNCFINTLYLCFSKHRPLIISPDDIWLLICQGFSNHINENSEKFRELLVHHQGKKEIVIRRDNFIKGIMNPWREAIHEFSIQIKEKSKPDIYDFVVSEFSTTNANIKSSFELTLMNTMSNYFDFNMYTLCGIPSITLLGTKDDYCKIIKKLDFLNNFELEWWTDSLKGVLNEFVNAFENKINPTFWKTIFKNINGLHHSGSVPRVNGWCIYFFPYCLNSNSKLVRNHLIPDKFNLEKFEILNNKLKDNSKSDWSEEELDSFTLHYSMFDAGVNKTSFKWLYFGKTYEMELFSGFFGSYQDPETKAIRTQIGWAISDKNIDQDRNTDWFSYNTSKQKIKTETTHNFFQRLINKLKK